MTKSTGKVPKTNMADRSEKRDMRGGRFVTAGFVTKGQAPSAGVLAKTKLKKAGGSLVVTVPASARNLLHLTEGQEVAISVEGSKVVMEPVPATQPMRVRRPKYTLDELLVGADPEVVLSEEERAWHDAAPVGREVW